MRDKTNELVSASTVRHAAVLGVTLGRSKVIGCRLGRIEFVLMRKNPVDSTFYIVLGGAECADRVLPAES